MEQSTVLVIVGIAGNLVLITLLVLAWRLLMQSEQSSTRANDSITNRELDELLTDTDAPRADGADQLAGLFRFDSWSVDRAEMATNGKSHAADG